MKMIEQKEILYRNSEKETLYIFQLEKREYRLIDCCTKEQVEKYINTQIKSMQTQYFNTLKPVKKLYDKRTT